MYYFKTLTFRVTVLIAFLLSCFAAEAQIKKPFAIRDQRTIKGDMTMIANSIVNRYQAYKTQQVWVSDGWWGGHYETVTTPEILTSSPYDGSGSNDNFDMSYIDIDGDASTFSSSKATLAIPDAPSCSKVVYAALYWSGTYKYNGADSSTGRENTFNQVKLKLPNQTIYTNITGTIIYDDVTAPAPGAVFDNNPYACYADVTTHLAGLADPNGEYTVANIRASNMANLTGGVSAGWTLYVVYENPKYPGRYITSYDGFASVSSTQADVDITYGGFVTVPQKVQAKLIVSALEGDKGISKDKLRFKGSSTAVFVDLENAQNTANNFFNGSISVLDATGTSVNFGARSPNSLNTLGYDSDIINISNLLQPSSTEATLKITSKQDSYYMFFNAFSVDVIAPDIQIIKTVEQYGLDAGGANVGLGDELDYILTFKNIGNDDAKNVIITDVLPINTFYNGSTRPLGVAEPTINPVTGALEFIIPQNLVKKGTESIESVIKIHVKVASTCSEFTDACSNEIRNKAFAAYTGVINNMPIVDGSVTGLDKFNCMAPIEGPANFIVGLATCDFIHNEVLCGTSLELTTGNGYQTYQWYRKDPGGDILLPAWTGKEMTVTTTGEYYVVCTPSAPCLTQLLETFIVKLHASSVQNNPVKPFQTKDQKCNDTGEIVPVIVLCGLNDYKMIQTGITGATSIVWEKLTGSCDAPGAICIDKSPLCTWTPVGTGPDYKADTDGTFRMTINYAGGTGCSTLFYFKVSKNDLDPQVRSTDIFCAQAGEIKVTVPSTYEIRLINQTTGVVLVDYPNMDPVFPITTPGVYKIELRHQGITDGCEFTLPNIGIAKKDLTVELVVSNKTCKDLGSIRIKPSDVKSEYLYTIAGPITDQRGATPNRNELFDGLGAGTYTVTVTTTNGCTITDTVTVLDYSNLSVSGIVTQNISCVPGTIQLTGTGGEPTVLYAIDSYTGPAVVPPTLGVFSDASLIEIPVDQPGTYVFIMKDANGCIARTAPISIAVMPGVIYTTAFKNVSCNAANDGSITYTVTATNGYTVSYELLDVDGNVIRTNITGEFEGLAAGTYTVNLIQTGTGNVPCAFPKGFTITEPAALAGTANLTQAYTCTVNGIITVNVPSVTGGKAPYKYSIDGTNFGTATSFTNLTPGTYTVTIKDANNCTLALPVIVIPVLPAMTDLTFTLTTPVTCPTEKADVTVAVTGGKAPFTYAITDPVGAIVPVGATFTGLAPGTYMFTATDANNCTFSESYTINSITKIDVTGTLIKNVLCFGDTNGSLKYTVSGFSTNYNYSIVSTGTPIASATNYTATDININGLLAGTYTITVTDNVTNCTATATVVIAAPTALLTVTNSVVEPTCTTPGSIKVTAANGWGNYMYQLNAGTPQSSNVFNGVAAGTYTITVVDANGCVKTSTATLTLPVAPAINITGSDLCFDANGASITVNTTGGRAPFTYTLNGTSQPGKTFTDLLPGNYIVKVTDFNNCTTADLAFTINPKLTASASLMKGLTCSAPANGNVDVTIGGGKAPFKYEVKKDSGTYTTLLASTASTTVNHVITAAGTYTYLITDAAGCTVTTSVVVAPLEKPVITSVVQTQNIKCFGDTTGAFNVTIDANEGLGPYTISVRNVTTNTSYGTQTSSLPAGDYEITITDANGCTSLVTAKTITQPVKLIGNVTKVDIQCIPNIDPALESTSAGSITVTSATGGTGPYTYIVTNNFGFNETYTTPTTVGGTKTFTVLSFGIYQVEIIDANGCSYIEKVIMASPPGLLAITVTPGASTCATGGEVTVKVNAPLASHTYQFAILTSNVAPYAATYFPADNVLLDSRKFSGLTPGLTYTFVVYDTTTKCYTFESILIPNVTPSTLTTATLVPANLTCTLVPPIPPAPAVTPDGSVKFSITGYIATEVDFQIYNAQSNSIVVGAGGTFTGLPVGGTSIETTVGSLPPGEYYILFEEKDGANIGCKKASAPFTISVSAKLLVATAIVTKNDNCKPKAGIITAGASDGAGSYQYMYKLAGDPAPTVASWTGSTTAIFNVDGGNYVVYVKDKNNCIQSVPVTVPTDPSPEITATVTDQCTATEGAFTVNVNLTQAGIGPYTYKLDTGAFVSQTAPFTYTNLSSGNHTITVRDANGCTFTPVVVTKIYPPLNVSPVITAQPWCAISNGAITVTGVGGSGTYHYELQTSAGVPVRLKSAVASFTGLAPGNYKVVLYDTTTNCTKEAPITLDVPTPVAFAVAQQNVTCYGGNNGSITISLPGTNNNPVYTYAVSKGGIPVAQTGPVFTGLTQGVYTVTVTSGRGCSTTGTITITEPPALTVTATATAFACDPDNTVKTSLITITETGGVGPYWYSINGVDYFTTNTFNIVDNGTNQTFTAYVKDTNNCPAISTPVVINKLPVLALAAVTQVTKITCTNDETAKVTVTGGSGNFKFELLPSGAVVTPGAATYTANFNLGTPGTYTFKVTDFTTDCTIITAPYVVLPFDTITASVSNAVSVNCFGASDGKITLNVAGYTGLYTYKVLNALNAQVTTGTATAPTAALQITGLPAGILHVEVTATATPFCDVTTTTITVPSPADALTLILTQTTSVGCDNKGSITTDVTGGWGTYEYEFINNTTGTQLQAYGVNNVWTDLPAGTYTVNVKDAKGCVVTKPITLTPGIRITANIVASTGLLACHGDSNATVTAINVQNGQGPGSYQYILNEYDAANVLLSSSGAQFTAAFTGLGAGIYSITVTDGWNCFAETTKVTIAEPAILQGTLSVTKILECTTGAELTLKATGGTAPYTYKSTAVGSTPIPMGLLNTVVLSNMPVGTYQYEINDANGCAVVMTNEITIVPLNPLEINLTTTKVNCSGEVTAEIVADATGGLGAYKYALLKDVAGVVGEIVPDQDSGVFAGLGAGIYYVRVTSKDCAKTSTVITITDPPLLVATPQLTHVKCVDGTDGKIVINTTGGTGTMQYAISPDLSQFDDNNVFGGLKAGTYTIIVQDGNGCFEILENLEITEPALVEAAIDFTKTSGERCLGANDGTIAIDIWGGMGSYKVSIVHEEAAVSAPEDSFVPITGSSYVFENLAPGPKTIFIQDINGCAVDPPLEYTITEGIEINPTAAVTQVCTANTPSSTLTISIDAALTPADVQYSINGTDYFASNVFTNVTPGIDKIAYAKHTNGCIQTVKYTVATLIPIAATAAITQNVLCNAGTTGVVTATATGGTGTLQYAISPAFTYQASNVFTGLSAGTYTVKVKDAIGCELQTTAVTVTQPAAALAATVVPTHEICINTNDGTIKVTPSGGTGPYFVSLNGATYVPVAVTDTFTALADGVYTIDVKDTNNCAIVQQSVTINAGVDIQAVADIDEMCTGNVPSTVVTINVNAAVAGAVTYSFDGAAYSTTNTFTYANTAGGAKWVDVKHSNGCIQRVTFTINNLTPITAAAAITQNVLCNAGTTGVVTATATGGTGTLQYAISPAFTYQATNVFTGLAAGTYTVKVKDAIGCELQTTAVTVTQPAAALAATVVPTHEICINTNDGTIKVTPSGGTGPYFVSLNGATYVPVAVTDTFTALADGVYTIDVKDTNNCAIVQQSVTINAGVDIQAVADIDEMCTGNVPSTVVTINVNAAVAGAVTYSFDGAAYSTTNTFTYANTAGGAKWVDVKHSNGCIQRVTFTINNLTPITAAAAITQNVLCNAGTTGVVTATATGGTGTLQYAISPAFTYQATNVFTGLAAGTYTVKVKDAIGCELQTTAVTVTQPAAALAATVVPTHEICINTNDGTIKVTPSGGTGPYFVSLNGATYVPVAVTDTFTALADGVYTIDVKDTNNCAIVQQSVTINAGVDIQAVADIDEMCTGNVPSTVVTINVNAAVAGAVTYSFDGAAYSTTNTFTYANTAGGAKWVDVKHTNGCIQRVTFTINNLTPITATAAITQNVLCNAGTTGVVTATATGGTGTLQYAISPAFTYQASNVFTGLAAGTYTVKVKDAIGCELQTTAVTVTQPAAALAATVVPTHEICINTNDGTIKVTPSGGTGPYFVSLNGATYVPVAVTDTFTALADGVYTIDVKDTNNCAIVQQSVTINAGVDIQAVADIDEMCTGNVPSTVVTINVNAAVAGAVTYSFDGAAYSTTNTFTYANTAGGAKWVDVKHTNGCIQRVTFTINNLTPITATAAITQNVLCNAGTTGVVTATATGGTGTLQYAISPAFTYQASNVFTGLAAGTYTVKVKDAIGCELQTTAVTVTQPAAALAATVVPTHEICINTNDGTIKVTPSGGTGPYFVSLNGATYVPVAVTDTFTALADGVYTIDVKDTNNCAIVQQSVTINAGVDIQAVADIDEMCTGNVPSTVVTINVNAAVAGAVTYSFDGAAYSTTNTFTYANTAGGAKWVDVKHSNGCIQRVTFTINNLTPITAAAAITQNVLCNAGTTGVVTATATGGTGTLQYAISPAFTYQATNVFTGLAAGTYTVKVKDAIGCELQTTAVTVTQPAAALAATVVPTHEICINTNDGTIKVTPSGGTGPYFVSLNGATYVPVAVTDTFTALADGVYTIDVKDTNNCAIVQQSVTINAGVDIQAVADIDEMCTGNVPSTVVTINVNAAVAGAVTYSFDGAAYSTTNTFTYANTAGGAKWVDVKHTNGCIQRVTFTINNLTPITATAAITQNVLCNAGTTGVVTATATGGTGTLQYAISPAFTYQASNVFTGLAAGTYTVKVKDAIGCELQTTAVTVTQPAAALAATVVPTHEICINTNDGTIKVTPSGGTGPYFVSLNGATYVPVAVTDTFTALADGVYTIDVKDTNNCAIVQQSVTINAGVDIQAVATPVQMCTGNVPSTVVTINVNPLLVTDVTYSLDNINGTYGTNNVFTFVSAAAGAHTVYVKHANGCTTHVDFNINNLIPIGGTASTTANVLCFEGTTGEVTVTATGGTGALQYAISPNYIYQASNVFAGLTVGTYTIKVKDAIGCEFVTNTSTVSGPTEALTAVVSGTPETCANANDGTIKVTPAGGTAPYSISLNGGTAITTTTVHTFIDLADGLHTIDVVDANGCVVIQKSFTVAPGVVIQPTVNVKTVCETSTITISVNPAVAGNVTYFIDGNPTLSTVVTQNFTPGTHTVRVDHVNGCSEEVEFEIAPVVPIVIGTPIVNDIACYGMSTGTIEVSATGGTGTLEYALYYLNDYQNGGAALYPYSTLKTFIVSADTYVLKVHDAMGCEVISQNIEVKSPSNPLSATVTAVPETCVIAKDGRVQISNITGGTAPYSVALNTQTEANFIQLQGNSHEYTGLYGGIYDVFIRDVNGCYLSKFTVVVENGVNIKPYTTTEISCDNNVQTTSVTVRVNPAIENEVTFSTTGTPGTYTTNNVFEYTTPGERTIYILHENGCAGSVKFTVAPRVAIVPTATATAVLCKGEANGSITVSATGGIGAFQYGIAPNYIMTGNPVFNGLAAGDHIVRVEDAVGCYTDITVKIDEPLTALAVKLEKIWQEEICVDDNNGAIEVSVLGGLAPYATSLDANGTFTEDNYMFDNLDGGTTYTIYVKDANGCITSVSVPLAAPININAKVDIVYGCEGNTITITTTDVFVPTDLTHTINGLKGGAPQTSNIFTNLSDGKYTVEVLHVSGCSDTVSFSIENPLPLTLTVSESGLNQITAAASGGSGSYRYTFDGNDVGINKTYTFYKSGTYEVTVTDSRGCTEVASITVEFVEITVPDVVTPDGDGHNDVWGPGNTGNYPKITTDVFDRYGRKLATLNLGQTWDCKYEGNEMPSGDYWYLIKLNADKDSREFIGHFTIYR